MSTGRLPSTDGGIQPTVVDAKGDLLVGVAADSVSRLAVGSNDQVLTADSSTATGLKWATVASGFNAFLNPKYSGYYIKPMVTTSASTMGVVVGYTHYVPIFLTGNSFDRISIRTASSFAGTAVIRLGLYNANTTTGKPSTVYLDAGTVTATVTSTVYEITITSTPPAGWYFLALNAQSSTSGDPQISGWTSPGTSIMSNIWSALTNNGSALCWTESVNVTSGFATANVGFPQVDTPNIGLRMA